MYQKFIISCFVVTLASLGLWFGNVNVGQFSYGQNVLHTEITGKDTLKPKVIGLQRDTTFRPDTVVVPEVRISDLSYLSVCPGSPVLIPFTTQGAFKEDNKFIVQISNASGKFVNLSEAVKEGPVAVTLPANRSGSVLVRVISTSPEVIGKSTRLTILPLPHARMELIDGSTNTKIGPGQMASYRVMLTGAAPWSFTVSDGTTVTNTLVNPFTAQVAPSQTSSFKVTSVNNTCGSGTTSGEVVVQVSQDTLPVIALKAIPRVGFRLCTATPFQINFSATGKYEAGNGFIVQLSDSTGQNFKNVSELIPQSPIMAKTPSGLVPGIYKLRVVSTFPTIMSDTVDVAISAPAKTVLRRDTLQIAEGESTNITLDFSGGGPWFVLLSDGTYQNDIRTTPYSVKVSPLNPTTYTISSSGGFCGVGDMSGSAFVNVKIPPPTIATGSLADKIICSGTEITVPFTTTGRFNNANKFLVQIKDTSGRWVYLPTIGGTSSLRAKILPPFLKDTLSTQQLRVISTDPLVEGTPTTIQVMMPNAAQASVTGVGVIRPGGSARLRVSFKNGLPPWSFVLSDGTTINGTFINPYQITVNPRTTTEYKVVMVNNTCGTGTTDTIPATIRVETN
ncbi:hypothetical protein [Runella sp.]|uniref:hypothetical protein n=1 Tax=Runella sp. TaxID=1960881 RepID=UPI003D113C40